MNITLTHVQDWLAKQMRNDGPHTQNGRRIRPDGSYTWYFTDWADEYGERGYHSTGPVILGDWWIQDANGNLIDFDRKYPRLSEKLAELGIDMVWHDEWEVAARVPASKAYRTEPDSYGWQRATQWVDDDLLTPDDDLADWLEWATDNPVGHPINAVQVPGLYDKMLANGWTRWPYSRNEDMEAGLHPGMNDTPDKAVRWIRNMMGSNVLIVLEHTEASQFYSRFAMWFKPYVDEDEPQPMDKYDWAGTIERAYNDGRQDRELNLLELLNGGCPFAFEDVVHAYLMGLTVRRLTTRHTERMARWAAHLAGGRLDS